MYSRHLPNLANLKAQARRYRSIKEAHGQRVSHSQALELIARRNGFFDWNTAAAHAKGISEPDGLQAGKQVSGRYMGHAFEALIVASTQLPEDEMLISLDLLEPVDVVESAHFSNVRKRISATIGPEGRSRECLSGGIPHLEVVFR